MKLIISTILFFILSNVVTAQINPVIISDSIANPIHPTIIDNVKSDIISSFNLAKGIILNPLHYEAEDFILTGIIAGATALSFSADNAVRQNVRKTKNSFLDKATQFGEKFGNPHYGTLFGGVLYLGGHVLGDKDLRITGLALAEAVFINKLITKGLKMSFGRSRPFKEDGNFDIDLFQMENDNEDHSMPSGHTSTAFTIATVLSQRINNVYASITLYSIAGLTAFQRIYSDSHWFSDTVLGAALGTVIGLKVVKFYSDEKTGSAKKMNVSIYPQVSSKSYGLNMSLVF